MGNDVTSTTDGLDFLLKLGSEGICQKSNIVKLTNSNNPIINGGKIRRQNFP